MTTTKKAPSTTKKLTTKKKVSKHTNKSNAQKQEEEDHIRVAVRVRPFNSREKRKGCKLVISMQGNTCTVFHEVKQKKKTFKFDFCYWSVNNDPPGYVKQADIFRDLGHLYVDNAFKGYNSSVFAYGQTGSGKTYTMLGTSKGPGLIPRGCEELFRRIEQDYTDGSIQIEIEASYLEVYMDQIFDLLAVPTSKNKKRKTSKKRTKLPIRFHPKKGSYVEGLTKHGVANYRDIQKLMNVGLANRTVAETQMNKISSRSHCIFTLYMNQYGADGAVVASKINLIDLAGSERVNKTGVVGQRMEELKKINTSLSALGDVIAALADRANFVPYNNSILTTLLSESLGGNSKTIMMAAISPADDNFEESLSTLRYADRVKRIKQTAKKNSGVGKAKMERELRNEIEKLRHKLELRGSGNKEHVSELESYLVNTKNELRRVKLEHTQKVVEMRDTYLQMREHLESMGLSSLENASLNKRACKLINISGDPSLSGSMVFFLTREEITVGSLGTKPKPNIALQSNGDIKKRHAIIRCTKTKESISQKALDIRSQVWKLLFNECDINKDGFLNLNEFNAWAKQVLQRNDFNGFSQSDFKLMCKSNSLVYKSGLSWIVVRDTFITNEHKASNNINNTASQAQNMAEIAGIPAKKINAKLMSDLQVMIFDEHNIKKITKTAYDTIEIEFNFDLSDNDLNTFEYEIRDLFSKTTYGKSILFLRQQSPQLLKFKNKSAHNTADDDLIEKIAITIESANPANNRIMIFVNKQRIKAQRLELQHGDHILLGNRHVFQFINPTEALENAVGNNNTHASASATDGSVNSNAAESKENNGSGSGAAINSRHASAASSILDDSEFVELVEIEASSHKRVETIDQFQNILLHRMKTSQFRVGNIDVKSLQRELLKQREENVSGMETFRQMRDAFMEDYQVLSNKCSTANQMSLQLNKSVLFDVSMLPYFDLQHGQKADRIIVTRTCHYSNPEMQKQMKPPEFEALLKQMKWYHELAEMDGENVAAETLDEDPFVPSQTESLLGEAKLKISGRRLQNEAFVLPIQTFMGDKIGEITIEIIFKLLEDNERNCYDMKKMENKSIKLIIGIERIETDIELKYINVTFCCIGKNIITMSDLEDQSSMYSSSHVALDGGLQLQQRAPQLVHLYEDNYEVDTLKLTPAFRNFLSNPGILFRVWAPVFESLSQMPPIIAFKIRSTKITLNIQLPDGDTVALICKTGNKINSLKRKIEFKTEIADYQQTLRFEEQILDNVRTLLDYNIFDQSVITLSVENSSSLLHRNHNEDDISDRDASLLSQNVSNQSRGSITDVSAADFQKELYNQQLSESGRSKIKHFHAHSLVMEWKLEDLESPSNMTLESYSAENMKLKEQLIIANKKIEQLQREVLRLNSQGNRSSKNNMDQKIFGSWRRSTNNNSNNK